jgi:hypothetical protein
MFAVPGECFVSCVINHLLHNMQRVFCAGIHARTLADRFESFEDPYG